MNRLDFTKTITSNNFESSLITYFDQLMSLYGVLHEYDFKTIDNNNTSAIFTIKFKTAKDSNKAYNSIPGKLYMYEKVFYVDKSISRNSICINMQEEEENRE